MEVICFLQISHVTPQPPSIAATAHSSAAAPSHFVSYPDVCPDHPAADRMMTHQPATYITGHLTNCCQSHTVSYSPTLYTVYHIH